MNLEHALSIDGWLGESEAEYLADAASRYKIVGEIGSWMGRSTAAICAGAGEDGFVVAVDTWQGSPEHEGMLQGKSEGWLFEQFRRNTSPYANLWPLRKSSVDAAQFIANSHLRFSLIFIDGCHEYESVLADILAWRPLLTEGGILCGHDFYGDFPGVRQAVKELVHDFRMVPNTNIWSTETI